MKNPFNKIFKSLRYKMWWVIEAAPGPINCRLKVDTNNATWRESVVHLNKLQNVKDVRRKAINANHKRLAIHHAKGKKPELNFKYNKS